MYIYNIYVNTRRAREHILSHTHTLSRTYTQTHTHTQYITGFICSHAHDVTHAYTLHNSILLVAGVGPHIYVIFFLARSGPAHICDDFT